jgi:hypothetical protein
MCALMRIELSEGAVDDSTPGGMEMMSAHE